MSLILRDQVFAPIWLAGISTSTLLKTYKPEILQSLSVPDICDKLLSTIIQKDNGCKKRRNEINIFNKTNIPLRMQANLCIGAVRIFECQVDQLLNDCAQLCLGTEKNVGIIRKATKRQRKNNKTAANKRICLAETTNLPAAYFTEFMEEEFQSLQSLSQSSLIINTNVNVQVKKITMQDMPESFAAATSEVEQQLTDDFGSNSEILHLNDLILTSSATAKRCSTVSFADTAPLQKIDGTLPRVSNTIVGRQKVKNIKKNITTIRKATKKCFLKKKSTPTHKSFNVTISSTPKMLRKRVSCVNNQPTTRKRAKLTEEEQRNASLDDCYDLNDVNNDMEQIALRPAILNCSNAFSDVNNNQQENEIVSVKNIENYNRNQANADASIQQNFSYLESERQRNMWLPNGVLNLLAEIWLQLDIDERYTVNVYWFLGKANSRFDRALGFHSLLTLVRDRLVELFNHMDTIQIRYINNK